MVKTISQENVQCPKPWPVCLGLIMNKNCASKHVLIQGPQQRLMNRHVLQTFVKMKITPLSMEVYRTFFITKEPFEKYRRIIYQKACWQFASIAYCCRLQSVPRRLEAKWICVFWTFFERRLTCSSWNNYI